MCRIYNLDEDKKSVDYVIYYGSWRGRWDRWRYGFWRRAKRKFFYYGLILGIAFSLLAVWLWYSLGLQ